MWQNQCRGKKRNRGKRSPRRPYWLDQNNIETIYDSQNFPLTPSDVPFADPGQGSTYEFASPPKSKKNAHHSRFFDAVVAKPINEIYHDIILSAKNALKHSKHFKDEYVSF